MILPGKTIGMLGGGQLGRMTGQAARSLGYGFAVYEPSPHCPAGHVADLEINAPYDDEESLERFAQAVDVVSYEFENVDVRALERLSKIVPIYPNPDILYVCQNREREKQFLKKSGFPHAPFSVVENQGQLQAAIDRIGAPSVLKTANFGYDGKGQQKIDQPNPDTAAIWAAFGGDRAVLEGWMDFELEISVMVASNGKGDVRSFPVSENIHTNHILDYSIVPARIDPRIATQAEEIARDIAAKLGLRGILGVEIFVLKDGSLAINELAPRPHNSGHYTIDACATSQFEQFVRAVCGLPLGSPELLTPVTMVNILGEAWSDRDPNFELLLADGNAKLHLYGKESPRVGRKMGHFCVLGADANSAFDNANTLKGRL